MNYNFIYFVIIIFLFNSCQKEIKSIEITDFSKSKIDTIKPNENTTYSVAIFEIEGYSNDTIKIEFHGYKRKLSGRFKRDIKMDYYGGIGGSVVLKFDPYKAKKGELKIKYGIN